MINLLISGSNGHMGQVILNLVSQKDTFKVVAGYDINPNSNTTFKTYTSLDECSENIDVIIDFSNPSAFNSILKFAKTKKIPLVMATTGLSKEQINQLHISSKEIPIFHSANMSLGINLLIDLVKKATIVLENDFDIEIIEKHHNQKVDAPSGTALYIADSINETLNNEYEYNYNRQPIREKRPKKEIGLHAVRGGTIVGEHSVIFAGSDEIIEINHIATSKKVFATGSLSAAKFINGKEPGLYNMDDVISK